MYDLIIRGGTVLDGLGGDGYIADVGIQNGKIAAIGENLSGAEYIDARGLTVTPGFIDSHSHSDNTVISYPDQREKVEQGITYSITGQCGGSAAPSKNEETGLISTVSEFFEKIKDIPQGSGSSMLIGHNTLRKCVMGSENRDPSAEELEKMKALLSDGLSAGAIGMSFGLYYAPGSYAKEDELVALAKVVKEYNGIISAHIRGEGNTLIESVEEFLRVIKASGCRAVFSHHKTCGVRNYGKVKTTLALIDQANSEGADVYLDVYPYTASHTSMISNLVPAYLHPKGTASAVSLLDDKEFCDMLKERMYKIRGYDFSHVLVTAYKTNKEYEGKTLNEVAEMRGDINPYETGLNLLRESGGDGTSCTFSMCEEDVRYVISHPRAMICTDSPARGNKDRFHPRLVASFTRAIARYVRLLPTVPLPEMIRKMTSLPASVYSLDTKGVIRVGMDADLCIFDAEKIADTADYVNCESKNVGLNYVIIAGEVVLVDNNYNGTRAAYAK